MKINKQTFFNIPIPVDSPTALYPCVEIVFSRKGFSKVLNTHTSRNSPLKVVAI